MTIQFVQPSGQDEMAGIFALEIRRMISQASADAPRSSQVTIGPSELGVECARRLGYKLLDWPRAERRGDPWASEQGRAIHAMQERNYRWGDPDAGRYLVEQRVTIRGNITGSADLYDRKWATVFDWKYVGESSLAKYRRNGPGATYRTQAHLYGLGFENAGEKPERVAIVFLPRAATLDGMYVWTEEYDRQVALDALDRMDSVVELLDALNVEDHGDRWSMVPATPGQGCTWCPFFLPGETNLAVGCPGNTITEGAA